MTKETVFNALMQSTHEDIAPLADQLRETVPYTVIKKPCQELIMFQAEETVEKIDFNVGEVLTTSAEVRVNDTIGFSMVMSMNENLALDCALLIGVFEAQLPQKKEIELLVARLTEKREAALRAEREVISSTRVNFELMGGQDPNVSHNSKRRNK